MNSRGKRMVELVRSIVKKHCDEGAEEEKIDTDFDSDDSIKDPTYKIQSSESSDSACEEMGRQLEYNLTESKENSNRTSIINKKKRNSGQSYLTSTNKIVQERKCIPLEICRKKCSSRLSFEQQEKVFHSYWSLGDYKSRVIFVGGLLDVRPAKRMLTNVDKLKNRKYTYYYHVNVDGVKVDLCQKCFRYTLCETDNFIKSVAHKKIDQEEYSDKRGKGISSKAVTENQIAEIKDHVLSFPAYESHYSRRHTSQLYFTSDLSLAKLYSLYINKYSKPVSLSKYSQIFKEMNIKFRKPKLDGCSKCDLLKVKLSAQADELERINLLREQKTHHQGAELAYEEKKKDKEISKNTETTKMFTFDLQQCLPTPFLKISDFFYKRPLWTFNLTIHDSETNNPSCYMWHEAIANRGGNEIASCVFEHLSNLPPNLENVIYYSDCCSGQNKNSYVAAMFLIFLQTSTNIKTIDHKFLVPGHTHMECDSDHALIEKSKKTTGMKLHHPRDWYQFIRSLGKKRNFNVIEMEQEKFLDFGTIAKRKFVFKNKSTKTNSFNWRSVKWLRYTKEFGTILYKNSFEKDEEFKTLVVVKRGVTDIRISHVEKCYNEPIKINKKKKEDLISMLPYIDVVHHNFYQSLEVINKDIPNVHPDFSDDEDCEIN